LLGVTLRTSRGALNFERVANRSKIPRALSIVAALWNRGIVLRLQESGLDRFLEADSHLGKGLQEVALKGNLSVGFAAGNILFLQALFVQIIGKPLVIDCINATVGPNLVEFNGDGVVFDILR